MTWNIGDHGFSMTLSKKVPGLIRAHLRPWLISWLRGQGLELKDVALPELVRLRAFEATHRMVPRFGRLRRRYKPRLAQDAVRRTRRDTQALKSSEHVADATRTPIGVRLLHREHRVAFGADVDTVLDGGTASGRPSTIIDCTTTPPRVLRDGPITNGELLSRLGAGHRVSRTRLRADRPGCAVRDPAARRGRRARSGWPGPFRQKQR